MQSYVHVQVSDLEHTLLRWRRVLMASLIIIFTLTFLGAITRVIPEHDTVLIRISLGGFYFQFRSKIPCIRY
jgi:hypothetical protein